MKRKFLTIPVFFTVFYIFLTVVSCACGFFGIDYNKKNNEAEMNNEKNDNAVFVNVSINNDIKKLALNEYLYGVVAAEMPASFEVEALKAQAVAARTEAVKKMSFENEAHKGADVCDNAGHCQAYYSDSDLKDKYGEDWYNNHYDKIKNAVLETDGIIATYNDEPITAVFHSTSSGMTENSKDVWGGDMPYLVSVKSEGEEQSPRYTDEKSFSFSEFKSLISKVKAVDFWENPQGWISDIKRNNSGSINTLMICGVEFKGTQLRSALSLRSTNFEISVNGEKIIFKTRGNGHGVGMSQYGANYMAKQGYTYEDILKKYYTGISLEKMNNQEKI